MAAKLPEEVRKNPVLNDKSHKGYMEKNALSLCRKMTRIQKFLIPFTSFFVSSLLSSSSKIKL